MATASKKPAAKKATLDDEARLVKNLADILDKTGLAELEYKTETLAIRLSRLSGAAPVPAAQPVAAAVADLNPATAGAPVADAPGNLADHPGAVKSPMVGTYYESAEPGAAPFAKVGDKVAKGQTICIIEAMKVMNTITAPQAGSVKHVACENGQPVEFDQLLIVIE